MNNLRKFCAGLILTLALTASTFAGNIECGGFVGDPPPPPTAEASATGDIPNGITSSDPVSEVLITLLTNLLTLI